MAGRKNNIMAAKEIQENSDSLGKADEILERIFNNGIDKILDRKITGIGSCTFLNILINLCATTALSLHSFFSMSGLIRNVLIKILLGHFNI